MDRLTERLRDNYREIEEKIATTAAKAGISSKTIRIVAVTKTHPVEVIDAGLRAGIRIIGENKVQEAEAKIPELQEPFEEFHYIGHLQKNKVNKLLRLRPSLIHSIDKLKTAESLNRSLAREGQQQKVLIQVNTSGEESKFGLPADYPLLRDFAGKLSELKHLEVFGLMTIGKFTDNEREIRECFILLRRYFESLQKEDISGIRMEILSMGMSGDYLIAVEEGANLLRIGTAIFGQRNYNKETGAE